MAEDNVFNGLTSSGVDDQTGEEFFDPGLRESNVHVVEMTKKVDALQRERDELSNEIAGRKEEIKKLTMEIEGLRKDESKMREKMVALKREVERSQEATKAAEAIAARAAKLETEVVRLQHDAISEMNAAEEARADSAELRRVLAVKESRVMQLEIEVEGLKQAKAESEMKARDFERKIGVLQMKEIEERSKKVRAEEELREKVNEKERELLGFRHKIEELERVATVGGSELEESIEEKLNLEESLRESEEKARSMESNILRLQEEVGEAVKVIRTLKEKAAEAVNGAANAIDSEVKGLNGLELQWPVPIVVAGSTGAIATVAAVFYVCFGKRR